MSSPGQPAVVWVEREGRLEPLRVLSGDAGTLTVQDPAGREERLARRRVVFSSAASRSQVAGSRELAAHRVAVDAALSSAAPAEVWELMLEEGLQEVPAAELAELLFGDAGPVSLDALQVFLAPSPPWFRSGREGRVRIQPRASVEERLVQDSRTAERRKETDELVGALALALAGQPLSPAAEPELELLARIAFTGDVPARGARLLEGLFPGDRRTPGEQAFGLMVKLGRWGEHEDLNLRALGLPRPWSAEALQELDALLAAPPAPRRGTVSLPPGLLSLAIDDETTREVDDALALEDDGDGLLLHVLIADVAAWVRTRSALDQEARERGTTLYHPTGELTMLPEALSCGPASLTAGVPRLAVDIQLRCSQEGRLIGTRAVPVVLRLDRRVTYTEADRLLAAPPGDDPVAATLHRLNYLACRLRALRLDAGAVIFQRREFRVRVDGAGAVSVTAQLPGSPAHVLVSECMILACAGAGGLLSEHAAAGVFRVQARPEEEIRADPARLDDPLWIHENLRRLRKVEFSLAPGSHASLGVPAYTQVTSPLRRYADLVMQRQLLSLASTGIPAVGAAELGEVVAQLETTVAAIQRAQNDAARYWTLVALRDRPGEELNALVLEEQGRSLLLDLVDWGIRAKLHPAVPHRVGDRIRVLLVRADPREDRIVVRDGPREGPGGKEGEP